MNTDSDAKKDVRGRTSLELMLLLSIGVGSVDVELELDPDTEIAMGRGGTASPPSVGCCIGRFSDEEDG